MAEENDDSEKTEEPTQKRLDDAHEKGDVAKSQEVSAWFSMMGTGLVVAVLGTYVAKGVASNLSGFFENSYQLSLDGGLLAQIWTEVGYALLGVLILPMLALLAMAVAGNVIQHKFVFSTEPLKPKLSKISPASGFKRLFSKESLVNFIKGLAKLSVVTLLMLLILYPQRDKLDLVMGLDPIDLLPFIQSLSLQLVIGVIVVMTVIAGMDFLYQKNRWHEKQKMSIKEIKEEFKQQEGDPIVKAKLRQLRMERSRKRMMSAVPDASVILTNPTHYSVALKYEQGMGAPLCLAKGIDDTAMRIREIAKEHSIPIVQNPPLARALFATVDIDAEVPEEHYKAVAEVISYIMKLKNRTSWSNRK
ncbi:flagellar biosynthesis protein FlhB [Cohaesibacter celericrescens]|uniref:Flagellar biosynthetic protein FlhB n=1 Tax=Cohaesibacter celericrescens TaxID=2067669 RepID=A0A2N5XWG9_9HYPH|nr:flagellar biosynthesis protein FlhB [Cohaesibacter celericrescens]PLW78829.1 flagellar biosynthesis protein FlhB [Cohaesibacter celericrescens]